MHMLYLENSTLLTDRYCSQNGPLLLENRAMAQTVSILPFTVKRRPLKLLAKLGGATCNVDKVFRIVQSKTLQVYEENGDKREAAPDESHCSPMCCARLLRNKRPISTARVEDNRTRCLV